MKVLIPSFAVIICVPRILMLIAMGIELDRFRIMSPNGFISRSSSSMTNYATYPIGNCGRHSGNFHNGNSNPCISVWGGILTPFFRKPKLKIVSVRTDENTDFRWRTWQQRNRTRPDTGELILPYEFHPLRRFINVIVENEGNEPARNCEIGLRLLQKNDECRWLSNDDKSLVWNDGNNLATLWAKGGKGIFHLAFSQEHFTPDPQSLIGEEYCGVVNSNMSVVSWIGSQDALVSPENKNQDGLCQGTFKVHVEVAVETGHTISAHFNIKVGGTWKDLEVESGKFGGCDCDI
jgi:hypothetical protein